MMMVVVASAEEVNASEMNFTYMNNYVWFECKQQICAVEMFKHGHIFSLRMAGSSFS